MKKKCFPLRTWIPFPCTPTLIQSFVLAVILNGCADPYQEKTVALETYRIEDGFNLKVIASEPLLQAPVAIDFDDRGRTWVVEMPGFMDDLDGTGEGRPTGTIKILEDLDNNGIVDRATVFLDSLVMPRALALVYGGLLYAEPPNLWFVEIDGDRPGVRTLVDAAYAPEGNPEYQSNGLLLNIDNWIYSAGTHFRYRYDGGRWLKQPTSRRGQWGIAHDNFGRLYYNTNSQQLLGDFLLPNVAVRNRHWEPDITVGSVLTEDQRVYPLFPTPVNRGYVPGVLDADSLLLEVTAACGPVIYRGGSFPEGYAENAFVCVPEANLVKRNLLDFQGGTMRARQAWENKEFLASTDQGFRPVNLKNGPDGALYIVDMHRGTIQHHAFLSPYLRRRSRQDRLDTLIHMGRLLKVSPKDMDSETIPDFENLSPRELTRLLVHPNGWLRDRAQHLLTYQGQSAAIDDLVALARDTSQSTGQIHALRTLEGLKALDPDILIEVAHKSEAGVVAHAIVLLEAFTKEAVVDRVMDLFKALSKRNEPTVDLYLASTLGVWASSAPGFREIMGQLASRYPDNAVYAEAFASGMGDGEEGSTVDLSTLSPASPGLDSLYQSIFKSRKEGVVNPIYTQEAVALDSRTQGVKLYRQICAACHGVHGEGLKGLAPPLRNSEHVTDREKLALIVLHGLKGPIKVNGISYTMNHAMPGLATNPSLSDQDITAIISYVSNAFSKSPTFLGPKKVAELRGKRPQGTGEFTIGQIDSILAIGNQSK